MGSRPCFVVAPSLPWEFRIKIWRQNGYSKTGWPPIWGFGIPHVHTSAEVLIPEFRPLLMWFCSLSLSLALFLFLFLCLCLFLFLCLCLCLCLFLFLFVCLCLCLFLFLFVCLFLCLCLCLFLCLFLFLFLFLSLLGTIVKHTN